MGLFSVGDVWLGGRPVGAVKFTRKVVSLDYQPKRMVFVDAGLSREEDGGGRWLVPSDEFPLGARLPRAQLAAISDGKYPYRFLVPCACLLSFYYGGSSELYRALFSPGFGKPSNPAFDPSLTLRAGSDLHLRLRPGIPIEDALLIAPWTTDYGIAQVARIYESHLVPRDGIPGYPRALPPFLGPERLEVEGIGLALGTPYARFLILRIQSGTLPIPYERIVITNPELAEREPGRPGEVTEESPPPRDRAGTRAEKSVDLEVGDAPAPGAIQTLCLPTSDRFRDKKEIVRLKRPSRPPRRRGGAERSTSSGDDTVEQELSGAVGDAGPGTLRRTVLVVREHPTGSDIHSGVRARSPAFPVLHEGLDALDRDLEQPHEIIVLDGLAAGDGDPCASVFPKMHEGKDAYHAWYYRQRSRARRRKLLVAAALYRRFWFALLEPEQKPHEQFQMAVVLSGLVRPPTAAITGIAAMAAADNCIWPEGRSHGLDVRRQKHTWGNAEEFVSTITALLDAMLGIGG